MRFEKASLSATRKFWEDPSGSGIPGVAHLVGDGAIRPLLRDEALDCVANILLVTALNEHQFGSRPSLYYGRPGIADIAE